MLLLPIQSLLAQSTDSTTTEGALYKRVDPALLQTIRKLDAATWERLPARILNPSLLEPLQNQLALLTDSLHLNIPTRIDTIAISRVSYTPIADLLWKKEGFAGANISNVGLSNWAAGGESSLSVRGNLRATANRKTHNTNWQNSVQVLYGLARQGDVQEFRKTDDDLQLRSSFTDKLNDKWSLSYSLQLQTQLTNGYRYTRNPAQPDQQREEIISSWLAPGYLLASFGAAHHIEKEWITAETLLSPLSGKLTYVRIDSLAADFGVPEGRRLRNELGLLLRSAVNINFDKKISWQHQLNLFANFTELTHTDVNWETILVLQVTKYIRANFSTNLIYDHDVEVEREDGTRGREVQFKHLIDIGFGINF
jgi:hypothetical protein